MKKPHGELWLIAALVPLLLTGCLFFAEGEDQEPVPPSTPTTGMEDSGSAQTEEKSPSLIEQKNLYEAAQAYKKGLELYEAPNPKAALPYFEKALQLNPQMEAAKQYRQACLVFLGKAKPATSIGTQYSNLVRVRAEAKYHEARKLLDQANREMADGRYESAKRAAERAIARFETIPVQARDVAKDLAEAKALSSKASTEAENTAKTRKAEYTETSRDLIQKRQKKEKETKAQEIKRLRQLAKDSMRRGDFNSARLHAQTAAERFPDSENAQRLLKLVHDQHMAWQKNVNWFREAREWKDNFNNLYDKATPYSDNISFGTSPARWRELTATRKKQLALQDTSLEESPENAALRAKISNQRLLKRWKFEGPLEEAIQELSEHFNITMYISRDVFERADLDEVDKRNLSLRLRRGRSLETVLGAILKAKGLDYYIKDRAVIITDQDNVKRTTKRKIYPITDLLITTTNFEGPSAGFITGNSTRQREGEAEDFIQLSGEDEEEDFDDIERVFQTGEERAGTTLPGAKDLQEISQFIKLITETIEPDSWNGPEPEDVGNDGYIVGDKGVMTVVHTEKVHRQIDDLLQGLRKSKNVMVTIEARFLKVTEDFLQDIRINIPDRNTAITTTTTFPSFLSSVPVDINDDGIIDGFTTVRTRRGTLTVNDSFNQPGAAISHGDINSSSADALTLTANSVLDSDLGRSVFEKLDETDRFNFEYFYDDDSIFSLIVSMARKHNRSTILDAPKITVFNGQRAFISILRATSFVGDTNVSSTAQPPTEEGNVSDEDTTASTDPVIDTLRDGIVLDVKPTVTHDQKYVQIEVRAQSSTADLSNSLELITRPDQFSISEESAKITLPILNTQQIRTTVMVPDQGTILLGGLSDLKIREGETGVPWFSKIPILGMMFTQRTKVDERSNLILLLRAEINILDEVEQKKTGVVTED